ncbi:UDP-glucose 4-epimerase GalE [soil metagenome]
MKVLVTGGAGFVGSHTVVALIEAGHEPVIADTLVNSDLSVIDGIEAITGLRPELHRVDVGFPAQFAPLVDVGAFDAVVHMAAYKAVGESVEKPLRYYDNNVAGTVRMLQVLDRAGVKSIVFSSSATVYGQPETLPLDEETPIGTATNPYGWTKIMMEQVMTDLARADSEWSVTLLRYFNPVGAHESGLIGESPLGEPANLMPYVNQVAAEQRPFLRVFGLDYETRDGSAIRDYIHVMDLAEGHVRALEILVKQPGVHIFNLGTGRGTTVLELVQAFSETNRVAVPWEPYPRRAGDVAESWASVERAKTELGWETRRDLRDMSRDAWNWQRRQRSGPGQR